MVSHRMVETRVMPKIIFLIGSVLYPFLVERKIIIAADAWHFLLPRYLVIQNVYKVLKLQYQQ